MIKEEFAHLREPRRIRLRLEDVPDEPVVLKATLIPTFGDCIQLQDVAGCRFYQPALARLAVQRPRNGFPCVLIHEIANPHDNQAIAVWTRGGRCGYIPRADNAPLVPRLATLEAEYGTPIAVPGELFATRYGLALLIETPELLGEV